MPSAQKQNQKCKARRQRAVAGSKSLTKTPARTPVKASELAWRPISDAFATLDFDDTGGAMMLEEITGVQVVYGEEDEQGRKSVKFLAAPSAQVTTENEDEQEWVPLAEQRGNPIPPLQDDGATGGVDEDYRENIAASKSLHLDNSPLSDAMPAYSDFELHTCLRRAAHRLGFDQPTSIQSHVWRSALAQKPPGRDIIGVAETGSGKTLAYGLPILQSLINATAVSGKSGRELTALVLAPTRELAMQVKTHLDRYIRAACADEEDTEKTRLPLHIVAVTGGMSVQKQKRMLAILGGPDIIVATPGRLADLIEQDESLARAIRRTRFLVLDEADRMIEQGHFAEVDTLIGLTRRKSAAEEGYEDDFDHAPGTLAAVPARDDLRTYVFSATMSKDLQQDLKRSSRRRLQKKDQQGKLGALGDLLAKVDFRDPDPLIIDLLPESGLATRLRECKIDCLFKEKDIYLYYFLLRYPGRTLVFLSSIDAIRRLHPLFDLLGFEPGVLHSGMHQKGRMKSLEAFRQREKGLLFATDVAARGLDIPDVKHVVHFQMPRSADVYVHRNGRTARAGKEGVGLALCSPEEKLLHRSILKSLDRDMEPEDLLVNHTIIDQLRGRLAIASEIDKEQHRVNKLNDDEKWLKKTAEDLEIDVDDDDPQPSASKDYNSGKRKTQRARKAAGAIDRLKAELREELTRPLHIKGISTRYLTSYANGDLRFVDSLLENSNHDKLLGIRQSAALDDLKAEGPRKRRKKR